jgi:hypothetical protein
LEFLSQQFDLTEFHGEMFGDFGEFGGDLDELIDFVNDEFDFIVVEEAYVLEVIFKIGDDGLNEGGFGPVSHGTKKKATQINYKVKMNEKV